MNRYNTYITIDKQVLPIVRIMFLISKQFGCSNIIIFLNNQDNNESILEELEKLSLDYDLSYKTFIKSTKSILENANQVSVKCDIHYEDKEKKEDSTTFGIYNDDTFKIVSDLRLLLNILNSGNTIISDEKYVILPEEKRKNRNKYIKRNFKDIINSSKNSVKYKQYSRKLKK